MKNGFMTIHRYLKGILAGAAILCMAAAVSMQAEAAEPQIYPYGYVQLGNDVMWSNGDGTFRTSTFIHHEGKTFYADETGKIVYGFRTIDGKLYYLPQDGYFHVGWNQAGNHIFFVQSDGSLAVNTVIEGYVIGADGLVSGSAAAADPGQEQAAMAAAAAQAQAEAAKEAALQAQAAQAQAPVSEFEQVVRNVLAQCTTPGMTKEQKLRAAYEHICNITSYKRTYETPSGDWTKQYAMDIYSTGKGNCYRYTAAFAYLAKEIGYDVRICTGTIKAARGGVTPHGWAEVNIGGTWYICDPDMGDVKGRSAYYLKTYSAYPVKPLNYEKIWDVSF